MHVRAVMLWKHNEGSTQQSHSLKRVVKHATTENSEVQQTHTQAS
jgi:hypothetical protein